MELYEISQYQNICTSKFYEISYETLRNITYRNLYVKILRNVTNVTLKICEMLRLEALRNITSKILRSITCQILRKYTNYHEILCIRNIAMALETYEIFSREILHKFSREKIS